MGNPVYKTGEFYIDVNGNGMYDSATSAGGAMQSPRMLWKSYRMIWSGVADTSTSAHGSHIVGTVSGATLNNLTVRLNDCNYNKLSATSASDNFQLTASCSPDGQIEGNAFSAPSGIPLDPSTPGIVFNPTNGGISDPGLPSSYRNETDVNLQTLDGPAQISGNTGASVCAINASVTRTYDPGAGSLFESTGMATGETVTGTFSFAAPPDAGSAPARGELPPRGAKRPGRAPADLQPPGCTLRARRTCNQAVADRSRPAKAQPEGCTSSQPRTAGCTRAAAGPRASGPPRDRCPPRDRAPPGPPHSCAPAGSNRSRRAPDRAASP